MRIPFIAGNWKMYKNIKEAVEFAAIFAPLYHDTDVRTAIFAPFPQLGPLVDAFRGTGIGVGRARTSSSVRRMSTLRKKAPSREKCLYPC